MSNATCLLALPDFDVTDVWEFVDEVIVHIVMPRRESACARCGVTAGSWRATTGLPTSRCPS